MKNKNKQTKKAERYKRFSVKNKTGAQKENVPAPSPLWLKGQGILTSNPGFLSSAPLSSTGGTREEKKASLGLRL